MVSGKGGEGGGGGVHKGETHVGARLPLEVADGCGRPPSSRGRRLSPGCRSKLVGSLVPAQHSPKIRCFETDLERRFVLTSRP